MFVGVDHGTIGIRFAVLNAGEGVTVFELSRKKATDMDSEKLLDKNLLQEIGKLQGCVVQLILNFRWCGTVRCSQGETA